MRILWVGDWGRPTSFSRITEEVFPKLSVWFEMCLLAPPKNLISQTLPPQRVWHVGDTMENLSWEMFNEGCNPDESLITRNMKYVVLQISELCKNEKFDYVIFAMGFCESLWFSNYRDAWSAKTVVWTPLDYMIDSNDLPKSDIFITMSDEFLPKNCYAIGHGVSKSFRKIPRRDAIGKLRELGIDIGTDEIIVLNANNYVERKQFRLTLEVARRVSGFKLWLHTNIQDSGFNALLEEYEDIRDRLILTMNNKSDEFLNLVYNVCQIGLQTSWGEGWSLTNCEHAYVGGLQVVPNFLATKQHFGNIGYTYPVKQRMHYNEIKQNVIVSLATTRDIANTLQKALKATPQEKTNYTKKIRNYLDSHNWNIIANRFKEILEGDTKNGCVLEGMGAT